MARILLIEDEPAVRGILRRLLSESGHDVLMAQDATAAVELCLARSADLVITDLSMPGADVVEVVRGFRADCPALPIIVVSGVDRQEALDRLHRADIVSAVWLLSKPFSHDDLLRTVRFALYPEWDWNQPALD